MYVYILASDSKVTYIGVTKNLQQRLFEHREGKYLNSFTSRYKIYKLVYFEVFNQPSAAIAREKQLKAYRREKKTTLIQTYNPGWDDLVHILYQ